MKVYEFGESHEESFLMFPCAAELVMMFPERFYRETARFMNGE